MHHQEFAPNEALRHIVKCFWYNSREVSPEQPQFEVMPDGYAEIIFHFGTSCSIVLSEGLLPMPSPFIMGLQNQPVIFHTENRLEVIGIRCYPWTVFDLLGLPSGTDKVHIFEHPLASLQPTLAKWIGTGNVEEAIATIEKVLLEANPHVNTDSALHKAGIAMQETSGTLPVNQVAAAAHSTVRTLERKFKQSSGYSVKDVSALMRFEQVRNRLWHHPDTRLAGLAAELGYSDQAHLSKEFKRYSGTTPAAFARKAKKDLEAISGNFVAFIQV